jgi:hypothetical protein
LPPKKFYIWKQRKGRMSRGTKDIKKLVHSYRDNTSNLNTINVEDMTNKALKEQANVFNAASQQQQSRSDTSLSDSLSLANFKRNQRWKQLAEDDQDLIQTLKAKLDDQKKELEHRYESIQSIQRNFENLSQLYQVEVNKSVELKEKLDEAIRKLTDIQQNDRQAEISENQIQLLHLQYSELLDKRDKTEQILNMKLAENTKLNQRFLELNEANLRLKEQVDLVEERCNLLREDVTSRDKAIHQLKIEIAELQSILDTERLSSTEKDFEIRKLTANLKEIQRKYKELESNFQKDLSDMNTLKDKKSVLEGERQEHIEKIEVQLAQMSEQEKRVKILEAKIHRRIKDFSQMEKDKDDMVRDMTNAREALKEREDKFKQLESLKSNLESRYQMVMEENSKLIKQIADYEEQITDVKQSTLLQHQTVIALESKLTKEQKEVKLLQDKLAWHVENMDKEQDQTKKLEELYKSEIQKLKAEKDQITTEAQLAKSENEKLMNEVMALKLKDDDNNELQRMNQMVNNLKTKLEEASQLESQAQSRVEKYKQLYDKTCKERDAIQSQLDDMVKTNNPYAMKELKELSERWRDEAEISRAQVLELTTTNKQQLEANQNLMKQMVDQNSEIQRLRQIEPLLEQLKKRQVHLHNVIDKLLKTEEATESTLTCMSCMNLFTKPCVCSPCGHAYCEKCWDEHVQSSKGVVECMECNKKVSGTTRCEILEVLAQKSMFRKQQLETLVKIAKEKSI